MATSARLEELQQKFNENPRRYFAPLANEHRKLGDLAQAIALCRAHLPQQPQHVSGYIVLAQALFEAGDVSDARGAFELALDLDPENLIALRFLGDIARAQGEHLTARQWYERVLDADPRNDEITQLIRDLDRGVAAPAAPGPAAVVEDRVAPQPVSAAPNEIAVEASAATALASDAVVPIEDLATAWQHEVAALDATPAAPAAFEASDRFAGRAVTEARDSSPSEGGEPEAAGAPAAEFSPDVKPAESVTAERASEPEAIGAWTAEYTNEPQLAIELPPVEATPGAEPNEPSVEPNESWAEPDEEFVATVPPVTPVPQVLAETPPPFAEIDYSMFEAVADEEAMAVASPAQPLNAVPDPDVSDEPPSTPDDWFATASAPPIEAESVASHSPSETAFDLDAAFQSVLPNNEEPVAEPEPALPLELPQGSLPEFADPSAATWTPADAHPAMPDEPVFTTPVDRGDNVDDAFAELDRMTAALDSDVAGSAMLLPDEQYAVSPPEETTTPAHVDALIGRTPETGAPAIEETPIAFVTETMAELYLQQGFREEALAVYRQLLTMHPDDVVLAERVRALEGTPREVAPSLASDDAAASDTFRAAPTAHADAAGQSMRAFLGLFARRRAPMRRRERLSEQPAAAPQVESGLSALFGTPQSADVGSAAMLAGAFAEPNVATEALPGRPTRAADEELSLGDVFGSGNAASGARSSTFDEFFSTGSANPSAQSPLDEEGSDMVQFTAWLEGLKKK